MTTVSVFGGTGFLGQRLVRRLAAEGATLRIAMKLEDHLFSLEEKFWTEAQTTACW